jgi:nucleosome binding factor SPN SPT16 subunit
MGEHRDPSPAVTATEGIPMQTSDRLRMFRSLGLAMAALLLVGGAVLGSQAISGSRHDDGIFTPGASAEVGGDDQGEDATSSEDASESPEASPEANEDANDDASESPEADEEEASPDASDSEVEDASASPDDHGDNSGPGGDDSHDD